MRQEPKSILWKNSAANSNNTSLKTESSYYLAQINLKEKIYHISKTYFDTTLINLPKPMTAILCEKHGQ